MVREGALPLWNPQIRGGNLRVFLSQHHVREARVQSLHQVLGRGDQVHGNLGRAGRGFESVREQGVAGAI